jgi:pimeloyl-ACP methyl ester carboxylesterase
MADFVLIHGSGSSAAGWARLAGALRDLGHAVHLADLPRDRPELTSDEYARTVRGQVPAEVAAPIVVAHSACGLLLPAASRALGARRQVWLTALVPAEDRSFMEEFQADPGLVMNPEWIGKRPSEDPEVAACFLFHDCDPATLEWAMTTIEEFLPAGLYRERIALAPEIPSTYVVAAEDRTIRPSWSRRVARERLGVEPLEVPGGHCPHVSRPERLARLLHEEGRPT